MRYSKKKSLGLIKKILVFLILSLLGFIGPNLVPNNNINNNIENISYVSLEDIPKYNGEPYVYINNNIPFFNESDLTTTSYEKYSSLDSLGRCGVAIASIGKDIMPTEERGTIGSVKPTGWHTVRYQGIDGNYLYNRWHLIGYQLSGENANDMQSLLR